jgi:hypothetical protein
MEDVVPHDFESSMAEQVGGMPKPLATDGTPFGMWLRTQQHRKDRVGALARVAAQDPYWPGGESRAQVREYFVKMGARDFVLASVKQSWDEFEAQQRRDRTKGKRKAAKAARKTQQKARRRKK